MAIGTKKIEDYVPVVKYNEGLYTELPIQTTDNLTVGGDLSVTGDIVVDDVVIDALTVTGNTILGNAVTDTVTVTGITTLTSSSASSFAVGLNGATTPAFVVDSSTASQAAGLKVVGATTTGTVAVVTVGGASVNLTVNATGTGTIGIGSVSTGRVTITPVTTITGLLTATAGVTTPAAVVTKSSVAVPATAGAIAAGPLISGFTTPISIWVTSDAPTHSAFKGDLCINTGGSSSSTRLYINNGTTTWIAVTTAS